MTADPLGQGLLLLCRAKLKELLDDVVTKDIRHEAVGSSQDLAEHLLKKTWITLLFDELFIGW